MLHQAGPAGGAAGGSRLMSPALLALFGVSFAGMASFHLLLSVAPLYAASAHAGAAGAGVVTGALLLATVAAEVVTPRLVAVLGHRLLLGAALVLLGLPVLALPASAQLFVVVAVSAVRGLGFGLLVVLGSTLVAALVPPQRRGEGLGLYGIAIGAPGVLALPFGVFLVGQVGYVPVFVAGAVVALLGLVAVPGLPRQPGHREDLRARRGSTQAGDASAVAGTAGPQPAPAPAPVGILAGLRTPGLMRPAGVFAATAMAAGIVVTFLPLAVPDEQARLVPLALLVQAAVMVAARWWAGWYGDRAGPGRLMLPSLLAATAGLGLLVWSANAVAVLAAMLLFGAGFGVMQNASLALMFQRVRRGGYPMVGALWNLAFDAAMGLGAVGFGLLVFYTGYPAAFGLAGALMLAALVPAGRERSAR